jgi:vacuolar protein sorting-associated protein 13A/C
VTFSADASPVFKPSDFAIINTDGHSDFDIEKQVVLRDQNNCKLSLGLNFVYVRSVTSRIYSDNAVSENIRNPGEPSKSRSTARTLSSIKRASLSR